MLIATLQDTVSQSVRRRCYSTGGEGSSRLGTNFGKFWQKYRENAVCGMIQSLTPYRNVRYGNSHVQGVAAGCQCFELLLMLVTGRLC